MSFTHSPSLAGRIARGLAPFLLLTAAFASGCFEEGTRQRQEPVVEEPVPQDDPTASADPPVTDPVPVPPAEEYVDAGPLQFRIQWDGSTIPTSDYVRGVDAAAGEAERGSGNSFLDSGTDGGE